MIGKNTPSYTISLRNYEITLEAEKLVCIFHIARKFERRESC